MAAVKRLTDQSLLGKIALDEKDFFIRMAAIKKLTDQSLLGKIALDEKDIFIRMAAIKKLTDQDALMRLIQKDAQWDVRQIVFNRLDRSSLSTIIAKSNTYVSLIWADVDPAVVIAAKVRMKETTWEDVFATTGRSHETLGDVLGAAALIDNPQPTLPVVVKACHDYIRQGDSSRIPELRELLLRYGNESLAEDYLNCGNKELAAAGRKWAKLNGLNIITGSGSSRVRWGGR